MISTNHRDVVAETTDRAEPDAVPSPGDDRDLAQLCANLGAAAGMASGDAGVRAFCPAADRAPSPA